MFGPAIRFVLDTAFGLLTYAFLLRFAMQWLRAPFRNPVGQALVALTDWAVKPLRRVLPGFHGFDWATLLLAWFMQFIWLLAVGLLAGLNSFGPMTMVAAALYAIVELIKSALWLLIVAVIVQALLSWFAPYGPLAGLLNALTYRFLAPIRKVIPPIGGTLDLSPLLVVVLAQLVLMLPVQWLEVAVAGLFRQGLFGV